MRKVFQAAQLFDAQIVCDRLRAAHLEAEIFNANATSLSGLIPVTETWPEVWIREDEDFERAKQIVANFEAERHTISSSERRCVQCGEWVPGNFSQCWSCQGELSS